MKVSITSEVINGIGFLFEIIDSEVGDRMSYLDVDQKLQVQAVKDWLRDVREGLGGVISPPPTPRSP